MGVLGMLIFVPLFSVLYVLSEEYVVKCLKAKHISWKKYNLACEIPEGRWDGRLDEQESARRSKVKTEDGGEMLNATASGASSDQDVTGTALNSDATGTTSKSDTAENDTDTTGNVSNPDTADTALKSDSAESGENVSGVKRSRKRKR